MLERLMTDHRRVAAAGLISLVCVTVLLWLARGPRPLLSNVPFMAIAMLLIPIGYYATYGILYVCVQFNHISIPTLRSACGLILLVAAAFLVLSAMFSISRFLNHRPMPPPNFLVLGSVLGSMKAWSLQGRPETR
jgi:hypothetical protein